MAKNISKNQWFENIHDDVYINTAVLNNILIITAWPTNYIETNSVIAKVRNPKMLDIYGSARLQNSTLGIDTSGNLIALSALSKEAHGFGLFSLKSKQLETDFYSPEQLAEMYPDDPVYQVATSELADETKPVVDPTENMG